MRSILERSPYPESLLHQVLARIRIEGWVDVDKRNDWKQSRYLRASIIKACLNRKLRHQSSNTLETLVDSHLNKLHRDSAYQSGRLMAVLTFAQERALKKVNSTIVRRFLNSVSATPALHLGRLQVHAEVAHLPKLPKKTGQFIRDELKFINSQISPDKLPNRLSTTGRSMFVLGFYHELAFLEHKRASMRHLHRTMAGEWVRSAGEKQLADSLLKLGINYCYEPRIVLDSGRERIPDFMIASSDEENNVFIEWLGVDGKDADEYESNWQEKLKAYSDCGITKEGGDRGTLYVIDVRNDPWDEVRLISQLQEWFGK